MPDGKFSNKIVTTVPPSRSSNVTCMVISPENAESAESVERKSRRIAAALMSISDLAERLACVNS
jgi:hypothetical protein